MTNRKWWAWIIRAILFPFVFVLVVSNFAFAMLSESISAFMEWLDKELP